jgi:hypothetical protein
MSADSYNENSSTVQASKHGPNQPLEIGNAHKIPHVSGNFPYPVLNCYMYKATQKAEKKLNNGLNCPVST